MKRFLTLLALIALTVTSTFAQRNLVRSEDVKTFLKSKTYVVLEHNMTSGYNVEIKAAVKKSWNITEYEFITAQQFEEMRQDIDKSFLVLVKMKFPDDKTVPLYNFLSVSLGAAVKNITDMPDVCSMPLCYDGLSEDTYTFKLEGIIRFMQNYIRMIDANPALIKKDAFKQFNANNAEVKKKELWVNETSLAKEVRGLADLRKTYKHTVKVVKPEDIQKAIEEKNPNVLYLHKVGPEGSRMQWRVYKMIMGAGDDKMYYYDVHNCKTKELDGFLAKDFKKINK